MTCPLLYQTQKQARKELQQKGGRIQKLEFLISHMYLTFAWFSSTSRNLKNNG